MKPSQKRLTILQQPEIQDLFGAPNLTIEEKRFYFSLNDSEIHSFKSIRDPRLRCYFVLLLGYFKVKPVVLNVGYLNVRDDLKFIHSEYYPGTMPKRQNLTKSQRSRLYQRIFDIAGYKAYNEDGNADLMAHMAKTAMASVNARYLFDSCIEYLAQNKIAIPKYYLLQKHVSAAISNEKQRLGQVLVDSMPGIMASGLDSLLNNLDSKVLGEIRKSARNFTAPELETELRSQRRIAPYIRDIDDLVKRLDLSLSNLSYFASMVEYYTATKLRRLDQIFRYLYLICYLHVKYRQVIEHLADAFVFHCRKLQQNGKTYANEAAYREWQDAISNVNKAAGLLHFFVDDSIDGTIPFGVIRQRAVSIIAPKDIESVCLYLSDKKRSPGYYVWEYYDQQRELIEKTLRPIFLALQFHAFLFNKTQR